jgi:hypothetical protein
MCRRLQVEERMLSSVSGIKSSRVMVANSMFEGTWSCDVLCIVRVSLIRRKGKSVDRNSGFSQDEGES